MSQIKETNIIEDECDHISCSDKLPLQTRPVNKMIYSKGSVLHESGQCNPCGFFFKPSGCLLGADCEFCHLCTKQMFLQRKKARKLMGKEIKRATKNIHKDEHTSNTKAP
jgi:hypothetical protein